RDRRCRPRPLARRRCDGARPVGGRAGEGGGPVSELHRSRPPIRYLSRRTMLRGMAMGSGAAALAACGGTTASPSVTAAPTAAPSSPASSSAPPPTASPTPEPTPVPSPEGELFVYNWADYIGENTIKKFSDTYGIKVTYDFFDTVDTLLAQISPEHTGYDVTFPTSINVPGLSQRSLIQPLDLGQ